MDCLKVRIMDIEDPNEESVPALVTEDALGTTDTRAERFSFYQFR